MRIKLITLIFIGFSVSILSQELTTMADLKKKLQYEIVDTTKVSLNLMIADSYLKINKDSTLQYYKNALELAAKLNSKPKIESIFYKIGWFYEDNNEFEKAIENYEKAALYFNKSKQSKKEATVYSAIAYCYYYLLSEDKSIEFYLKSLNINKINNDENGIAINYNGIGNLYYSQENYEFAKKYFRDALTIYIKLNNKIGIANSYLNLGNAIADSGENIEGIHYYEKALVLLEKDEDKNNIATIFNNIGDCYLSLKQHDKAEVYFAKALKISGETGDNELVAIVYLNMAESNLDLKQYKEAIINSKKSFGIAKKIGHVNIEVESLNFLSKAYEALGNNSKAFYYLKENKKIREKLIAADKKEKVKLFHALNNLEKSQFTISDLSNKTEVAELKYKNGKKLSNFLISGIVLFGFFVVLLILQQTAKKNAFNLLEYKNHQINKMNEEIQIQSDNLRQINKTKDTFFSIIAHDLRSPFNSIEGFTELMIENIHEYDDEKRLKFLNIIKGSSSKASSLLNNLLIWANAQSGNIEFNPQEVNLIQKVSDVIVLSEIQAINKDIKILNKVPHNLFVDADEDMLATILRNLISNAIKFTALKGEIQILSSITSNFVEISVKDNGVGISQSDIDNLFSIEVKKSNVGTANEQGSGLGLILCKDFVEKHGGKLWVESSINEGSEFKFTMPIAV
ncbi:tetratricopeptide repeat protein [Lutibacter sp.]|uniref:ATP-binding protein n=1 Tax=Lutibacter sp. TaxID=1925666 RepID=UPI003566AF68